MSVVHVVIRRCPGGSGGRCQCSGARPREAGDARPGGWGARLGRESRARVRPVRGVRRPARREVRVGCDAGSTGQPGAIRPVKQALLGAALKRPGPARRTRIDPAVAAEALGLTGMESRVAVLLAEGMTVRDVAAAMGRGESTIRSHVKHMFAKHGLSRQADLVRLVLALGGAPESRH